VYIMLNQIKMILFKYLCLFFNFTAPFLSYHFTIKKYEFKYRNCTIAISKNYDATEKSKK